MYSAIQAAPSSVPIFFWPLFQGKQTIAVCLCIMLLLIMLIYNNHGWITIYISSSQVLKLSVTSTVGQLFGDILHNHLFAACHLFAHSSQSAQPTFELVELFFSYVSLASFRCCALFQSLNLILQIAYPLLILFLQLIDQGFLALLMKISESI